MKMRTTMGLAAVAAVLIGGLMVLQRPSTPLPQAGAESGGPLAAVTVPASFTDKERLGRTAFDAKCATCHGENAAGQDGVAPPLVHKIYEPGHHGDQAFHLAAMNGAVAHHWPFGNMPPVDGLTRADIDAIVAYVRALQRANGID